MTLTPRLNCRGINNVSTSIPHISMLTLHNTKEIYWQENVITRAHAIPTIHGDVMQVNRQHIDQLTSHIPVLTHINTLEDSLPGICNYPQPCNFDKTWETSVEWPYSCFINRPIEMQGNDEHITQHMSHILMLTHSDTLERFIAQNRDDSQLCNFNNTCRHP